MFKNILNQIKDEKLKINLDNNKINIINYKEIKEVKDETIKIDCNTFILNIYGENLIISKLLDMEVLIIGKIKRIELI